MSLYKRDNIWWIDFTTASGERIRQSADTSNKLEAQELHDRLKAASWRVKRLGEREQYTWDDAAAKWLEETSHKRPHHDDVLKLRWLDQYLGGKLLPDVTRDVVATIGARKRAKASPATANRFLALIRHPAEGLRRVGVDREGAKDQAVPGGEAAGAVDHTGAGKGIAGRAPRAPARYGAVRAGDRSAPGQRNRPVLVAGRSRTPYRVGPW